MISMEIFLLGLLITSSLTGLVTEAIKNLLSEYNAKYKANTLVGIVSLFMSVAIGVGYVVLNNLAFTPQIIICIIAQVFMSWLCAMVGYDKVIQTISQFKTHNKE